MKVVSQDGGLATLVFIADEVKPLKGYTICLHYPQANRAKI